MSKPKVIKIDDVEYVRKDEAFNGAELDGKKYVIVRSYDAGCFAGYLESKNGREVILKKARRLWYWSGAASLSQIAMEGVSDPSNCKFPCEVDSIVIDNVCEVIDASEKAQKSIFEVKVWKQ